MKNGNIIWDGTFWGLTGDVVETMMVVADLPTMPVFYMIEYVPVATLGGFVFQVVNPTLDARSRIDQLLIHRLRH